MPWPGPRGAQLKRDGAPADLWAVAERCRYCGSREARDLVLVEGDLACPRCAGSPLCDRCGHPRGLHTGVYDKHARTCRHLWVDFQTGTRIACSCTGFAPLVGAFRDAEFVNAPGDDTPLRVARPV